MTDVELVIKIPSEVYENIKNATADDNDISSLLLGIHEATPLPKGQGRLIERVLKTAEVLKQEPKVGHWVEDGTKRNFLDTDIRRGVEMKRYLGKGYHTYINEECSVCRKVTIHDDSIAYAYCPHCGAKMIESDEESEAADL